MTTQRHQVSAHIKNKPEAVLAFIADVRNRTRYLPSLKALTDVKGNPAGSGTTWKWKFAILGTELEGTARSLKHEPGKLYSFATEGGIESTWNYQVAPDGDGTKLTIVVEFKVPDKMKAHMPAPETIEAMKKAEGELVVANLKALLEK
jgi:carbon monoxide dehydrogenase subunit G